MKKLLLSIGTVVAVLAIIAAVPGPPSTEFTRGFMVTTNQTSAQAYLGISGGGSATNPADTYYVTNIFATNITINNNLTTSNLFYISGKGNTLVITQSLQLNFVKTNLLSVDSSGLVTTTKFGAGISWDPTTQTLSSTATGGDTTATNIVTLTMSGTNVSAVDFSLVQGGGAFKLVLTGNAYFGSPSGVSSSIQQKARIWLQQPSTGTCVVRFTNGAPGYAWPEGVSPTIDTNGGSVSYIDLWSDPFTNGILHGTVVPFSRLATNL